MGSSTTEAFRALEAAIARASGQVVDVTAARPLAGGASMETWSIDAVVGGRPERLVLRRDMGATMWSEALTRAQEFRVLTIAWEAGVKVPRPRWLFEGDGLPGGRSFFVMDRVDGESVGRKVVKLPELADAREGMAREMGRQLARIHAIVLGGDLGFLPRPRGDGDAYDDALRGLRESVDALKRDNPVWEYGLRWLSRHRPNASREMVLVHGDFRVGNLLVAPSGLAAVIDWEFAHVGDPHEDLAWPTLRDWRFERDARTVGGVGTLDDMVSGYVEAGGGAVDRRALAWWEIMGNLRWSVTCHNQSERHLSGRDRSVELASLGRKSAEMEWEIVDLIARHTREKTL